MGVARNYQMGFKSRNAFTLIELIMVIVILAILAAIAIPRLIDLSGSANQSAERGVAAGVITGLSSYYALNAAYPATLDGAGVGDCSSSNRCFTTVLGQGGISESWAKISPAAYRGPTGAVYTYNSASGEFTR